MVGIVVNQVLSELHGQLRVMVTPEDRCFADVSDVLHSHGFRFVAEQP